MRDVRLSSSSLQRSIACPASTVLPHSLYRPENVEKAANRGTIIHSFLEEYTIGVPREVALSRVPEGPIRTTCSNIDLLSLIRPNTEAEAAYVYDTIKQEFRFIGYGLKREYGDIRPNIDIPGTIDVQIRNTPLAIVSDYKTGSYPVPHPRENAQLLFFAAAVYNTNPGIEMVQAEIIRILGNGSYKVDRSNLKSINLDSFHDVIEKLQLTRSKLGKKKKLTVKDVNEGEHCKFCPAQKYCPAKRKKKDGKVKPGDGKNFSRR
jgi:hypothetical protein